MSYLQTAANIYKQAALIPDIGLCCATTPVWRFPELHIPAKMLEMNYGCGSTIHPRDLINDPHILYVGVGGGMELLQFAYFSRHPGRILGIDIVDEMLTAAALNMIEAEETNSWFSKDYITLRKGDALALPVADAFVDIAAQNCLFNIFKTDDLIKALREMYRVLKPGGRLVMSDPICEQPMSESLRQNEQLRALCLSGAIPLDDYVRMLTDIGFGTIEIRSRRPYRLLPPGQYETDTLLYIESIEVCAIKDPMPVDGPCVFSGKTAIYYGQNDYFEDEKGHILYKNRPLPICDKTASAFAGLSRPDIFISPATYHYDGGGCC